MVCLILFVDPLWVLEVVRFKAGTSLGKVGVSVSREQRKKSSSDSFLNQADGLEIKRGWSGEWELPCGHNKGDFLPWRRLQLRGREDVYP